MALSYTSDTLTISDDNAPDRKPLVLQLPQDDAVIEAAILDYLATPPTPDWDRFKRALLTDASVNQTLANAAPSAPAAVLALPAALLAAAQGEPADFRAAWLLLRRMNLVPQSVLNQINELAQDCHLPDEFVRTLGGQL